MAGRRERVRRGLDGGGGAGGGGVTPDGRGRRRSRAHAPRGRERTSSPSAAPSGTRSGRRLLLRRRVHAARAGAVEATTGRRRRPRANVRPSSPPRGEPCREVVKQTQMVVLRLVRTGDTIRRSRGFLFSRSVDASRSTRDAEARGVSAPSLARCVRPRDSCHASRPPPRVVFFRASRELHAARRTCRRPRRVLHALAHSCDGHFRRTPCARTRAAAASRRTRCRPRSAGSSAPRNPPCRAPGALQERLSLPVHSLSRVFAVAARRWSWPSCRAPVEHHRSPRPRRRTAAWASSASPRGRRRSWHRAVQWRSPEHDHGSPRASGPVPPPSRRSDVGVLHRRRRAIKLLRRAGHHRGDEAVVRRQLTVEGHEVAVRLGGTFTLIVS